MLRLIAISALLAATAAAQPAPAEADFTARDFRFADGKTIPESVRVPFRRV